jgi:hypothetical protein
MSERIHDKMGMKLERGEFTGGNFAPYGFDFGEGHWLEYSVQEEDANGHTHTKIKRKRSNTRERLLENPVEQDRLRQMAAWRKTGLSYAKIATEANRLGWPTKTGRSPWQAGNIAGVLQTKHTKRLLANIPTDERQNIVPIDSSPTGKPLQLRTKQIKIGGSYRHRGGLSVRTIDAIDGNTVYWHDHVGNGHCTKQTFLKLCISIATDQDIDQVQESVEELAISREKQEQDEERRRREEAFLNLCVDANKTNVTHVVIDSASELGMTYDEIMHNLAVLEKYRLYMRIKLCVSIATDENIDRVQESVEELEISRDKQEQDEERCRRSEVFLKLCIDTIKANTTYLVIDNPAELGMTYDEIMHNLPVLEECRLCLRIIRPTPPPTAYVYRPVHKQIRPPANFSQQEIANLKIPPGFEGAHAGWVKQGAPKQQYRSSSYYESVYWELVRTAVLERDAHKCFRCGGVATQAHHLNYDYVGIEHLHPDCLVSVCRPCHGLVEYARHAESLISRMERRLGALDNGQDLPRAYSRLIDYQANLAELRRLFSTGILHKKERQPMDVPFLDRYHDYLRQDTEKKTLAALQLQSWPGTDV